MPSKCTCNSALGIMISLHSMSYLSILANISKLENESEMRYDDNILITERFLMNLTLDIDKFYVSPYDKMMREFDATHPNTASQMKEIEKHAQIAQLKCHRTYSPATSIPAPPFRN